MSPICTLLQRFSQSSCCKLKTNEDESEEKIEKLFKFEKLPEETKELIFSYLDTNTIISCLEVSKSFRKFISNSPNIMKKLKLQFFNFNWNSKVWFIKKYGRYIKNVEFECTDVHYIQFMFMHFMPNLTKLSICITKHFSNLQRQNRLLTFIDEKLDEFMKWRSRRLGQIKLLKLEELTFVATISDIPSIFYDILLCKNLKKLTFNVYFETDFVEKMLVPLISNQRNLQYLEIYTHLPIDAMFTSQTINNFDFKLKTLKIDYLGDTKCDFTYLNLFLVRQADSLEELKTTFAFIEVEIYESMMQLKYLKRLKTHELLPCFVRQEGQKSSNKILFPNLTYLCYTTGNTNEFFDKIDTSCAPKLQCMNIYFGYIGLTSNPLRKLQHLKKFHFDCYDDDILKYLRSSCLEILVIPHDHFLLIPEKWEHMSQNLPNLKHLMFLDSREENFIQFIQNFKNNIKMIQKNVNLKLLELHFYPEFDVFNLNLGKDEILATGSFCHSRSILLKHKDLIEEFLQKFNLNKITRDEYFRKYQHFELCLGRWRK